MAGVIWPISVSLVNLQSISKESALIVGSKRGEICVRVSCKLAESRVAQQVTKLCAFPVRVQ